MPHMNEPKQYLTQFPALTTGRLILGELVEGDAAGLVNLRSDVRVNQYLNRPKSMTNEEAAAFIRKINDGLKKGWYYWVISLTGYPGLIGTICLWNFNEENESAEVGYELSPDFQGKGLMREALSKVISFGFDTAGFKQIIAYTHSGNARSKSLLEKSGFIRAQSLEKELLKKEANRKDIVYSLKPSSI